MKNLRSHTRNSSHFPNLLLKLETNRPLLKAINSTLIGLEPINLSAATYSNSIVRPAPLKPLPCLPPRCTGMQCDGAVRCRAGGGVAPGQVDVMMGQEEKVRLQMAAAHGL